MTAQSKRLPPATLRSLKALDAVEDKMMTWRDFRKACAVKSRAVHPFIRRLEEQRFIRVDYKAMETRIEMTFGGLQALKAHEELEA